MSRGYSLRIDLNSDLGEGFGPFRVGADEALFPLISSANVACGFHGGDPVMMAWTVARAAANGVAVGAHPGFPDRGGFGRRVLVASATGSESGSGCRSGTVRRVPGRGHRVQGRCSSRPHSGST